VLHLGLWGQAHCTSDIPARNKTIMDLIDFATHVVDSDYFDVELAYEHEAKAIENLKLHLDRFPTETAQAFIDNLSDEKLYVFILYLNLSLIDLAQIGNQNSLDNMLAESSSIDVLVKFNTELELLIATLHHTDDAVLQDIIAFAFDYLNLTIDFFNIDLEDALDESNASTDALIDRFNELRIEIYELVIDPSDYKEEFSNYEYFSLD